jgi:hypothetical protein
VKNTGDAVLTAVSVTAGAQAVSCPKTTLQPDETMTCTASGTAQAGNQTVNVQAEGTSPCGPVVTAAAAAYYFGITQVPRIDIQKLTNGEPGDEGTGPVVLVGSTVLWTYVVTNTGDVALSPVTVGDNKVAPVSCPAAALAPGASMVCTASGTAIAGQYTNTATATGKPPTGANVTDTDTSQYYGVAPAIALEKLVNGHEADTPPGPTVVTGSTLLWTYVVTNIGDYRLHSIAVSDDQGFDVGCPATALMPSASMTCTATSIAFAGLHTNVGTVTASWDGPGHTVTATDPANYTGQRAEIAIEKRTNGEDADAPPGPQLQVGAAVTWTYVVTNVGDVTLTAVAVSDDKRGAIPCPKTVLTPGESMTCTAAGTATAGQYMNVGTAVGTPPAGATVSAVDMSHYFGAVPRISIEKLVNGHDADVSPGPEIETGSDILWTYLVTNTGELPLVDVAVDDDEYGVNPTCPRTTLAVLESMTCTATSKAKDGYQHNIGTATGRPEGGSTVSDTDPAYYTGCYRLDGRWICHGADEGCSAGYWKNHVGAWAATGYGPSQAIGTVFTNTGTYYPGLASSTLLEALSFSTGSGAEGAARGLLKQAVAALLNAAHPGVDFPRSPSDLIFGVNAALLSNRDAMLELAEQLDADNNLGCPLD